MIFTVYRRGVLEVSPLCIHFIRNRYILRGKSPGIAKNLKERLEERNWSDPNVNFKVNIGYSPSKDGRRVDRIQHSRSLKDDASLEKLARLRKLVVPLEEVKREWNATEGPSQVKRIAEHYGVFEHLFGDAYFTPVVPLDIRYKMDEVNIPSFYGNVIKPNEASQTPEVKYDADEGTLWTLVLTNPDGNLTDSNSECVHWFIGNIPASDLSKGEVIFSYLQPFPPKGVGYQRCIFVLYKQEKRIDYTDLKEFSSGIILSERTFKTEDFYRKHQDLLTPAGLSFFQTDWHPSLTDFFHQVLVMKEPCYEYDFPKPYIKPQVWFPLRQPFNIYLDKYRDEKEIAKEFLLKKLKKEHPFKKPDPPPKYPNAFPISAKVPSWLRLEMKKERMGWGRVNDH
ncbi:39S ribosomal protein L38, mitochondrial [Ischnura elegans]|uniref:39S ribosomal protein L38, mitochondrial n=1 Tax=Ischnura elegans TaxID=197161 RepID=UPI001ED8670F|nr:39S ribosomal protein L38, mitochondrial [Ischnura elegans]